MLRNSALVGLLMFCAGGAMAGEATVHMNLVDAAGHATAIGRVRIVETPYGLVFTPDLQLPAGLHGFHVHENASCAPGVKDGAQAAAIGAGGHFDTRGTKRHGEPWGDGHLGDLPALYVAPDGTAKYPVLAPRLKKLRDIFGRSLMIHAGGDNHADQPAPLGGGGARIACGIIAATG